MKKIISLFQRDYKGDREARNEVTPGAEWVIAGEGQAYFKYDGSACMIKDKVLYKRYDAQYAAKHGKTPPDGFIPAQEPDAITGHWPGWIFVDFNSPSDQWHKEAWDRILISSYNDGTYELCGPKVNGNRHELLHHELIKHDSYPIPGSLSGNYEAIKSFLGERPKWEGIVWHHPDGRMVKIKRKDFKYK